LLQGAIPRVSGARSARPTGFALKRRRVVKQAEVMCLLRRELLTPLGNVSLEEIDRATVRARIAAVDASGRPSRPTPWRARAAPGPPAPSTWSRSGALWTMPSCRASGLPPAPPLALRQLSQGASLCGQCRTETAVMRWTHISASSWTIPAAVSKSGSAHVVPLPPSVLEIIKATGRTTSPLVFPGRTGRLMAGRGVD
jgi:integrase